MPNNIVARDNGDQGPNHYKFVFSGEHEPTKTTHRGATKNGSDRVYQNNQGKWVVEGTINGGADGWTYSGKRERMAFTNPGNVDIGINDNQWTAAPKYAETESFDAPDGGSGIVDTITDALDGGDSSSSSETGDAPTTGGYIGGNPQLNGVSDSPSLEARARLVNRDEPSLSEVTVVSDGGELKDAIESIPQDHGDEYIVCKDGVYKCGAIQAVLSTARPEHSVSIVGNPKSPLSVEFRMPVNLLSQTEKNEHVHIMGVHFARRSQFAGQFLFKNCVFSDLHGPNAGSMGGKPIGGDIRWSHVGHPNEPGKHAMDLYGGGRVFVNKGSQVNARGAFFDVNNNADIDVYGSVSFNGPGPMFADSHQVDNPDLDPGLNRFAGGKRVSLSSN